MKFTFNTGRPYAAEGQVINVEIADGRIWFYDESRGIAGSCEFPEWHTCVTQREAQQHVMTCYDHGGYRMEPIPQKGEARRG